ncbi:flagellin N-terminal helical domain-containing protein [Bacillus sp. KH172YL63]|uniref:flagellin N-terminal helical domain-containing protein n=1 Tax=Bacillus sp. KH172YL63 TaxID=2709784 RepID=UPI0013E50DD8|nr:flagellin [Bacillus sp. KH172YL63]BCB05697.1 flagellin [Bacillus sp. KH172YL63]
MRINHNIAALNTYNKLNSASGAQSKSMEKLSSGLRINKAGDDAAGLAISEKMRGQIRGLDQATRNSQDAISLVQTAEGALSETHSILQRQRELATQASNDTNTAEDRKNIQDEMDQLGKEIDRIAGTTQFNTKNLIDGSMDKSTTAGANVNSNSSLKGAGGAAIAAATEVLDTLTDKDGNSLGIQATDSIEVSYVKNGETKTVSLTGASTIADIVAAGDFGAAAIGANGEIEITATGTGDAGAVHGFTVSVKDSAGNVRSGASSALSSFGETTQATKDHSDGSASFQIGANTGQSIQLAIKDMSASALGVKDLKVGSAGQASSSIKVIDSAIQKVSAQRSSLGSVQNRLEHTINNLSTSSENLTAAESRIRDVDMAKEMMESTKNGILSQAAQAMLAQANQQPQGVLQLLR